MAVSRALRRLLRIRDLEEEQCRLALESSIGELNRLQSALANTAERDRRGRRLVHASAQTGELQDRLAGLEETRAADRIVAVLEPRIEAMEAEVAERRRGFLAKRMVRRQAETLIQASEAEEADEDGTGAEEGRGRSGQIEKRTRQRRTAGHTARSRRLTPQRQAGRGARKPDDNSAQKQFSNHRADASHFTSSSI